MPNKLDGGVQQCQSRGIQDSDDFGYDQSYFWGRETGISKVLMDATQLLYLVMTNFLAAFCIQSCY